MKKIRAILLALLAVTVLCAAGCSEDKKLSSDTGDSPAVTAEKGKLPNSLPENEKDKKSEKLTVKVYYPDEQGLKLQSVTKTVKVGGSDKYTAALKALLDGTKEKGLATIVPKQAKIKSVKVQGDTAFVDFDDNLVKKFIGGSTGEEMLVGSIVNTLTEFSEIKKVQLLVEGKKIESISGHLDLTKPVERMENLIK
ncbi:Sporulation and spore germination [Selenomonas ruminantium]|uniref:Sporulation and spore germination n=1 Tax=Selenomonas ruminantium TaxID=971 RepID=A0A1M6UA91_SELRU|nr:GerMN domain-containing protein [Selenomonas ruminantium]SHK66162.1 Sporulation and spore germination [Selenomonas ruminantium]